MPDDPKQTPPSVPDDTGTSAQASPLPYASGGDQVGGAPSSPAPPPKPTSSLAAAIRDELRGVLKESDYLDLDGLRDMARVARHGRSLVSVRDPVTRFDAKSAGSAGGLLPAPVNYGFGECVGPGMLGMDSNYGEWESGAMAASVRKNHAAMVKETLSKSPLAKALRDEILGVVEKEPFTPASLLEVEQLADNGHDVLAARLGMAPPERNGRQSRGMGGVIYGGYGGSGNVMAPSSSPETYGAHAIEQAISASSKKPTSEKEDTVKAIVVAKENGLDEVAAGLTQQLLAAPTSSPSPGLNPEPEKDAP